MSSFPAALVGVATAIAVGLGVATAHAQCTGGVWIAGAPALAASLADALAARGVSVVNDPSCASSASVSVEVSMSERGLVRVVLLGPEGATAVRDVDRMTTAALLVESWTQAPQLDLLEPPRVDASAAQAPTTIPASAADAEAAPIAAPPLPAVEPASTPSPAPAEPLATVSAAAIASFGNEGSSWFGAQLGACGHAGPTCIGASVRYLSDSGLSDATSEDSQRTFLGGDLDLSLPFGVADAFILTPAVALGLGWLDAVVVNDAGRTVTTDALRALVSGSFAAAVALIDWLSLELRLAATWSPLARQASWIDSGVSVDPDPVFLASVMLGVRADIR